MSIASLPAPRPGGARMLRERFAGALICVTIALAAGFVSEHYGGPQLLYALLFGLAFHFLMEDARIQPGIQFCASTVLRAGVAIMGVRITLPQISALGTEPAAIVVVAVCGTLLLGLLLGRMLRRPAEEGVLSAGAVAICGASAALAIASVLPRTRDNERFTLLAVAGVTLLSTVAMIVYPVIARSVGLDIDGRHAGIFFGGTIHDVAQVAAAGMMISPMAADTAMVVKLFRVLLLVPVVLLVSVIFRRARPSAAQAGRHPALIPWFLVAFALLVLVASSQALPRPAVEALSDISRWSLVTAIAAVGIKTSFRDLGTLGWKPMMMLVVETAFIAAFVIAMLLIFYR